ncbi:MAG TPA: succinate dehydrogenase cytochrome b subunit, partial [Geminicoccaceae bacterium]|nr:succinate dehydrogenase cytochrome b subunit [Geminicoccaceae bacterium]
MHMYGNLKLFAGERAFNEYAEHLREILVPILPHSGFLWLFRLLLVVALVVHAYAAFTLWSRANGARPTRYAVKSAAKGAARSTMMRWGGVFLLLFLMWHLIHFTIVKPAINADYPAATIQASPYVMAVASFKLWWVVLIYVLALVALGLHLFHGVWSGAQTLGWTGSPAKARIAKATAHLVAAVVAIGFALPPLAIIAGIVKG